jgi:hypothetical protein
MQRLSLFTECATHDRNHIAGQRAFGFLAMTTPDRAEDPQRSNQKPDCVLFHKALGYRTSSRVLPKSLTVHWIAELIVFIREFPAYQFLVVNLKYLCERNAIPSNPVDRVKHPTANSDILWIIAILGPEHTRERTYNCVGIASRFAVSVVK